jgi:hypothetical protein
MLPSNNAQQPKRKPAKNSKAATSTRLQFETLEARDCPTVVIGGNVPDSQVMQAAQMSAFFQQSALFTDAQPTTDPTASWAPRGNYQGTLVQQLAAQTAASIEPAADITMDGKARDDKAADRSHLQVAPNQGLSRRTATTGRWQAEGQWPAGAFAPYVDMGVSPTFDLADALATQNIKYFNLAFITADSQNRPSWSGRDELAIDGGDFDMALRQKIREVRLLGGHVAVSFGGPHGRDLALAIDNVDELQKAYRGVVDAYDLRRLDFDIEGTALDDSASIDRRSQAIGQLQRELATQGRKLDVWFTLPAEPTGLSEAGLNAVRSAARHGVELGGVNIKPTNYPDQSAADAEGKMGLHAIQASLNVHDQLQTDLGDDGRAIDTWKKIGVTPTIGRNEAGGETFSPRDAQEVRDFARQQNLGMVGMWSLNRDQQGAGIPDTAASAAGEHDAFGFTEIFGNISKALSRQQ